MQVCRGYIEMDRNEFLSLSAGSKLRWRMTARRSYFTFSLAVKEDEVITALEWQLGSEVRNEAPNNEMCILLTADGE